MNFILVIIFSIALIACVSNQFDVPELLRRDITEIKEILGEPYNLTTQAAIEGGYPATIVFKKNGTSMRIEYSPRTKRVLSIFLSNFTKKLTRQEMLELGKLNWLDSSYYIELKRVPTEIRRLGTIAEFAGIKVYLWH